MKLFNQKTIKWIQNKSFSANIFLLEQLEFFQRAEYLNNCVLNSNEQGIDNSHYCDMEIVVSLTTYGKRLYDVYLAIESIMRQTLKPNKIVLWLGDEVNDTDIPITLKKQQKRGLEIRYCKDIMSYTKLIPSLKTFPDSAIITIDDDNLYNFDLIENLITSYKKNPNLIHSARIHRMKLIGKNKLEKYEKWDMSYEHFDVSPLNFPTGAGGVLYPPGCFNKEIFNQDVFMNICKYNDDVWFKAMALLNGAMSRKIYTHDKSGNDFLLNKNDNIQDTGLFKININKGMNDIQIKAVFDKYNLYKLLVNT